MPDPWRFAVLDGLLACRSKSDGIPTDQTISKVYIIAAEPAQLFLRYQMHHQRLRPPPSPLQLSSKIKCAVTTKITSFGGGAAPSPKPPPAFFKDQIRHRSHQFKNRSLFQFLNRHHVLLRGRRPSSLFQSYPHIQI